MLSLFGNGKIFLKIKKFFKNKEPKANLIRLIDEWARKRLKILAKRK